MDTAQNPKKGMRLWGKLLIGCAGGLLLLVLAAFGGCLLLVDEVRDARTRAMEAVARNSMRQYVSGQNQYQVFKGIYAPKLSQLVGDKGDDGRELQLVPMGMAQAADGSRAEYAGYTFREMKSIGGGAIDWSKDFALCAIPAGKIEGVSARRTFIVKTDGVVWTLDRGEGAGFVEDFPVDPGAAGWKAGK